MLSEFGPETLGDRFMMGVVSLGQAAEYGLNQAALQTYVAPGAPLKFTDSSNRVFVAPNQGSLQAAATVLQPDASLGSWVMPYGDFPTDSATVNAYPGTMLMSIDVPTVGSARDAKDLGEYLSFAATTGQTTGPAIGQLPASYLPMTVANGMADEIAYTEAAAADVAAQNGQVPPLIPGPTKGGSQGSPGSTPGQAGGSKPSGQAVPATSSPSNVNPATNSGTGNGNRPGVGSSSSTANTSASGQAAAEVGRTSTIESGLGGLALPLALLLALIGAAVRGSMWWRGRRRTVAR